MRCLSSQGAGCSGRQVPLPFGKQRARGNALAWQPRVHLEASHVRPPRCAVDTSTEVQPLHAASTLLSDPVFPWPSDSASTDQAPDAAQPSASKATSAVVTHAGGSAAEPSDAPAVATGSKLSGATTMLSDRPAMPPTSSQPAAAAAPASASSQASATATKAPPSAAPLADPAAKASPGAVKDAASRSARSAAPQAAPAAAPTPPAAAPAATRAAAASAAPQSDPPAAAAATPAAATPSSNGAGPRADEGAQFAVESTRMIQPFHLAVFAILLFCGTLFATLVVNFTTDMGFIWSALKVVNKLAKSLAFRQSLALMVAIGFVRYGLEPLVKSVRSVFSLPGQWERSTEYFVLQQVYRPLEFLLFIAAISTVVEAIVPPLMAISKDTVRGVVRTMLSLTYVIASSRVVFNIKARFVQESLWQAELVGDSSAARRVEATDKLMSLLVLFVTLLLGLQAIGLDIQSVLAISGFGGLALGLAGREILENLFNGLLIISNRSFDVGEEILFTQAGHNGRIIEGIVLDIGWYQTLVRSFEREIFVIPNSVFSRTVVLNVTRKGKEWRFFESIGIRVADIDVVNNVVADMRRVIRQDARVIQKLHRRVFLDKLRRDELTIYMSFYLEAANRDAYMAAREDMYLAFVGSCRRHGAQLAVNRYQVELRDGTVAAEVAPLPVALGDFGAENADLMDSGLQPFNPHNPFPDSPYPAA